MSCPAAAARGGDASSNRIAQEVLSSGFQENYTVSNIKLCLALFT